MLAIQGARLYDGIGSVPLDDAWLVVDDGRIVYVGPREGAPEAGTTIDARGLSLLPGLIDCHVHLCFNAAPDFESFARGASTEEIAALCDANLRQALEHGVTTVRDLGGLGTASIDAARRQRTGETAGARCVSAGQVITSPGGHAHFIGREVETADEMAKAVIALHDAGAEAIKVVATGGVLTKGIGAQQTQFTVDQLRAGVEEAHARGLRVAAHAIGSEGIAAAVAAGVDSIEHGCFLEGGAMDTMVANPTWLVATLSAPDRISNGGPGVPEYARAKSAEVQVSHRASFSRACAAGVRIASGTDAGTPYNPIGALPYELRLMHENGLPLDRVLRAATSEAAALLGLEDLGTLAEGKTADLILIEGDPLADVGAYERVRLVMQSGSVAVERL